ncbi:MAG: hypothetical protein Q7U47_07560 [Paludibacter sp.]|nr:hypothetical protein [Paludibacter sp.]
MKTLKLILIASIVIISVANIFGQSPAKYIKRDNLRDKGNNSASQNKRILANDYSFSKTTGIYVNLTGAISVNNKKLWDDPEYIIPIGFSFDLYDITNISEELKR